MHRKLLLKVRPSNHFPDLLFWIFPTIPPSFDTSVQKQPQRHWENLHHCQCKTPPLAPEPALGQRQRVRRQYLHLPYEMWSPVSWITHQWKTLQNPPSWWEPLVALAFSLLCWLCLPAPAGSNCNCQHQKCTNSVKSTWLSPLFTGTSQHLWSLIISPTLPLTQPRPVSLKITETLSQATLPRNKLAQSLKNFVLNHKFLQHCCVVSWKESEQPPDHLPEAESACFTPLLGFNYSQNRHLCCE